MDSTFDEVPTNFKQVYLIRVHTVSQKIIRPSPLGYFVSLFALQSKELRGSNDHNKKEYSL